MTSLPARLLLPLLLASAGLGALPGVAGAAGGELATSPAASAGVPGDALARRADLEKAIDEARWKLGRVYLEPWLGLRDLSSIDTSRAGADDPASDVSLTVGAGLRAYLPAGAEAVWAAYALPEYVYWRDLAGRRGLDGRYGVGFFGSLGRTELAASIGRTDAARVFSRELEEKVDTTSESAVLALEVPLAAGLSAFAGAAARDLELTRPPGTELPPIDVLARSEEVLRAGLRWRPAARATVGLGLERSVIDFDEPGSLRSNRDTAPFLELEWAAPRWLLAAEVADRSPTSDLAPERLAYDRLAGSLRGVVRLGPVELEAGGGRRLVYSFQPAWAWFEDEGVELAARFSFGSRASLRLGLEEGRNRYFPFDPTAPEARRSDDYTGLTAVLNLRIDRVTLVLGVGETEYDSNLPQADRTVTSIRSALVFGDRGSSPWS